MYLKISNLIMLLLAEAWFVSSPDWEPAIVFISLLTTLILQEINDRKNNDKRIVSEHDKKLFESFVKELPSNSGSIWFIKDFDFGDSFPSENLENLYVVDASWNNSEYEFINKKLEQCRKDFLEKNKEFLLAIGKCTYPGHKRWLTVVPTSYQGEFNLPKDILEEIKLLNNLATDVYERHQEFIRMGNKELNK